MAAPIVVLAWAARIAVGVARLVGGKAAGRAAGATLGRAWKAQAKRLTKGAIEAGGAVLEFAANDLLVRAEGLAPEDRGHLVISGEVIKASGGNDPRFLVVFGHKGPSTRYALRMHDGFYNPGPTTREKKTDDGRAGRKFLERPYKKHRNRYQQLLANGIRIGIGRAA